MKHATILLLLALAISLSAIVNIGDEYIGFTPMGEFRKETEYYSHHDDYDYYRLFGETWFYYYYNDSVPTRIDSLHCYLSNDIGQGIRFYYDYTEFDDYYQKTVSGYSWYASGGNDPAISGYYKYDYQDRLLEFCLPKGYYGGINKAIYDYDANGNLILKREYNVYEDADTPRDVTTYEYDAQNREIYRQITQYQAVSQTRWNTWSNHPKPDSTRILNCPYNSLQEIIIRNYYDDNGENHHSATFYRYRPFNDDEEVMWERVDRHTVYTLVDGRAFPTAVYVATSFVSDPNDAYVPVSVSVRSYDYSDDYHSITLSIPEYENTQEYTYDSNWLLTNYSQNYGDGVVPYTKTTTWDYYGTSANDDLTAVPPATLSAYPNPARGMVNISLSKRDVRSPVEAKIYNIKGQLVRSLEVNDKSSDRYLYNWDCRDSNSRSVPAGVYLIRIKTNSGEVSKKVTVLK